MKPSVHLSRAKGYRELGMHDESMLELEEITDDDVYLFEVIESKFLTLEAAKAWDYADAISNMMRTHHPNRVDGWLMKATCLCELKSPEQAVEALLLDEERFKKSARYIFAIGCYYSLSNEVSLAREYVGRAIKMDPSLKTEFVEGSEFDALWDSF